MEIYNEVIRDLLSPDAGSLKVRESSARGVFVEAREENIKSYEDLNNILKVGQSHRHIGVTK